MTREEHIQKAKHNENFLFFIESHNIDDFNDWKITVLFYAGLHYVRAFLLFNKIRVPHSHVEIDQVISPFQNEGGFCLPEAIYDCYQSLYHKSKTARYHEAYRSAFKLNLLKVEVINAKHSLWEIKNYVASKGLTIS